MHTPAVQAYGLVHLCVHAVAHHSYVLATDEVLRLCMARDLLVGLEVSDTQTI